MRHSSCLLCLLLLAACLAVPSTARGGRGRGGGSFGGLFGGWRSKYGSKSSSSGGGRRVVSGSPVHTAMTVPKVPPPPPPPQPAKSMNMPKPQVASYPRQQLPPGTGGYPAGVASAPGPGTYYANAQALPAGAVYYAQPPTSMSMGSGASGFLTGMLAGRLMDGLLFGHGYHGSHLYRQQAAPAAGYAASDRQIIIINNGQQGQTEGEEETTQESLSPEEAANPQATEVEAGEEDGEESLSSEDTNAPVPHAGGIVCFPIVLNETDPQNAELVREVERVVCFPAPAVDPQRATVDCQDNAQCLLELGSSSSTTSTVPPIVAGEIGGAAEGSEEVETAVRAEEAVGAVEESLEVTSPAAVEDSR